MPLNTFSEHSVITALAVSNGRNSLQATLSLSKTSVQINRTSYSRRDLLLRSASCHLWDNISIPYYILSLLFSQLSTAMVPWAVSPGMVENTPAAHNPGLEAEEGAGFS
jgi:hypothetical protein